jgi:hypothetical protein
MKGYVLMCFFAALLLTGCGGGNEPVNKDMDRPIPSPKDKVKDK